MGGIEDPASARIAQYRVQGLLDFIHGRFEVFTGHAQAPQPQTTQVPVVRLYGRIGGIRQCAGKMLQEAMHHRAHVACRLPGPGELERFFRLGCTHLQGQLQARRWRGARPGQGQAPDAGRRPGLGRGALRFRRVGAAPRQGRLEFPLHHRPQPLQQAAVARGRQHRTRVRVPDVHLPQEVQPTPGARGGHIQQTTVFVLALAPC